MNKSLEGRDEVILEPELPIIDAHFHLLDVPELRYMLDEYLHDARAGHNIVGSVYIETKNFSRRTGPDVLKPLGEIEFANGIGAMCEASGDGMPRVNAGIVAHADMRLGDSVAELFDKGLQLAPDRLKGFRHVALDYPDDAPYRFMLASPPRGLLSNVGFRKAFRHLAPRGLSFDITVFHSQLHEVIELADAFPDTSIVLDHLGMPMNLDATRAQKADIFRLWRDTLQMLALRQNVSCKIGGLGMPFSGFGFENKREPTGYLDLAAAWQPFVDTAIEIFGTERAMMESNYPPDAYSGGYVPLWNAMKFITRSYSETEKADLYHATARRVYRLNIPGL